MLKRLVIVGYDALAALMCAFVLSCGFAPYAHAYIDPSVMTYTIQAVAGVAVALSAVAGVALRRGRKHLLRLLDIDENSKKEYEADVHRTGGAVSLSAATQAEPVLASATEQTESSSVSAATQAESSSVSATAQAEPVLISAAKQAEPVPVTQIEPTTPASDSATTTPASASETTASSEASAPTPTSTSAQTSPAPAKKRKDRKLPQAYKPAWKERLIFGFIAAFFLVYTIYYVAPIEIVAGASNELVYSVADIWWIPILPDLGIIAAITLLLSALRGRAFNMALVLVFAVGLCAYVQALFLNVGLPAADGATIFWADYMDKQVISAIVWIAIIVGLLIYSVFYCKRTQGIVAIISVFLVIVQSVGLASLAFTPSSSGQSETTDAKVVMTEDQLFTVNPNHNVVVFILDTYDTAYLTRVLDMNPHLLDNLTGFTNYENATSAMIPTRFAIPEMLTGQMPSFDELFSEYTAKRYERSSFLDDIYGANYSIGLYTDSLRIGSLSTEEQRGITSKTVNMHPLPNSLMDVGGCLYSLYQMGQYRDAPWSFKWAFWYYTDQINKSFVQSVEDAPPDETIYIIDDVRYYNRLCNFGLTLEEGSYDGAFRFIHLLGSHYPFSYDETASYIGDDESNVFKQSQGAIHIVDEYIAQLKELGVYENTTIIITADHGYWTITLDPIEETSTPIMFVKPEQTAQEAALPITVDEKPVSHLDLQATVLDAMGLDWSEYATRDEWAGFSMFGNIDPERKRYYLTTDSEPDLTEVQFREYLIDGNALDWENWHETGRTIDAQT